MLVLILLLGFISYQISLRIPKLTKKSIKAREAVFLDCDMASKIRELLDDPTMTTKKWKEWLPIFEAADKEVRSKCNLNLGRNADYVRAIISDRDLTGP